MQKTSCRISIEQRNCYCNGPGLWHMNMIQCTKCRRWFHDGCIRNLQKSILYGDRFFVFICSICNSGKEFLCRLELKWVDIAHLALYNLSVINKKKYSDFHTTLIPFVNENWTSFQLLGKVSSAKPEERKNSILNVLQAKKKRFKNGKEIKKSKFLWGLQELAPPTAPHVNPCKKAEDNGKIWDFKVPGRKFKILRKCKKSVNKIEIGLSHKKPSLQSSVAVKSRNGSNTKLLNSHTQSSMKRPVGRPPKKVKMVFKDTDFKMDLLDTLIPMPLQFTSSNNPFTDLKSVLRTSSLSKRRVRNTVAKAPVIHRLSEDRKVFKEEVPNDICEMKQENGEGYITSDIKNSADIFKSEKHLLIKQELFSKRVEILDSEKFSVIGKRVTALGEVEYLLLWNT